MIGREDCIGVLEVKSSKSSDPKEPVSFLMFLQTIKRSLADSNKKILKSLIDKTKDPNKMTGFSVQEKSLAEKVLEECLQKENLSPVI